MPAEWQRTVFLLFFPPYYVCHVLLLFPSLSRSKWAEADPAGMFIEQGKSHQRWNKVT